MSDDEVNDQDAQLDDVDSGEDESDPVAPELARADEQDEDSDQETPLAVSDEPQVENDKGAP